MKVNKLEGFPRAKTLGALGNDSSKEVGDPASLCAVQLRPTNLDSNLLSSPTLSEGKNHHRLP